MTLQSQISEFVVENYNIFNFNDMFDQLKHKYGICRTSFYDVLRQLNLKPNPLFLKTSLHFKIRVCKCILNIHNRSVTQEDYNKTVDIINHDYYQLGLSPAQINFKYHLGIKQPTASLYTAFGIRLPKAEKYTTTLQQINTTYVDFEKYRSQCQFRFETKHMPYVSGFDQLIKLGMRSVTNPNGVARDHKLSIKFGYDNNIDPNIIAHPANCEYIPFRVNSSKGSSCSITLDQLLEDIKNWPIH